MYVRTYVRTYRHAVIKWSTDRLHTDNSSAVLHMVHSVGYAEDVPTNRAAVGKL